MSHHQSCAASLGLSQSTDYFCSKFGIGNFDHLHVYRETLYVIGCEDCSKSMQPIITTNRFNSVMEYDRHT